jgi:nucleotide-binding universal stress UspA family protein
MSDIVIGTDGSTGSAAALRWGVREAELRGRKATALLAWGYLDQHHPGGGTDFDPDYHEDDARAALAAAVEAAVGAQAAAGVQQEVACDLASRALLDASLEAELLVVGARGLGGFKALLLGSVSEQCLHYAGCPVAVVHEGVAEAGTGPERIVVGVDGSPDSHDALRWAVAEARVRGATLHLIHAWQPAIVGGNSFLPVPAETDAMAELATRHLESALGAEDTTGLTVEAVEQCGPAAGVLLDAAADASLVVVGSRGRGGFAGLLLGSVSQQVARHAPCPVVVVRHRR